MQLLLILSTLSASLIAAAPTDTGKTPTNSQVADPAYGPQPGGSSIYSKSRSKAPPFPGDYHKPVTPTTKGKPGADDLLFQNLLSAEWSIYSFYQQGVEAFNTSSFTALGLPNNTYDRIAEIRDNEAGHLRIFQDAISTNSLKPGACEYHYAFKTAQDFLIQQVDIEIGSMVFLTGLIDQAKLTSSKEALVSVSQTETRHEVWSLIGNFMTDPFAGPVDTAFPYANQILELTKSFIKPGSCPKENPHYPSPDQHLPSLGFKSGTVPKPGKTVHFTFTQKHNQPKFAKGKDYYAVFFHGLARHTVKFDTGSSTAFMPKDIEADRGVIIAVIADEKDAPTAESVVAGPLIILAQPSKLTGLLSSV